MFYLSDEKKESRYDLSLFMEFVPSAETFDVLSSHFIKELLKLPVNGEHRVLKDENRPDLISWRIYGTTQHWWILMLYNRKWFFQDVNLGDVFEYPSLQSIEDLYFRLKALASSRNYFVMELY